LNPKFVNFWRNFKIFFLQFFKSFFFPFPILYHRGVYCFLKRSFVGTINSAPSVCPFACPFVRSSHFISGTADPIFLKFFTRLKSIKQNSPQSPIFNKILYFFLNQALCNSGNSYLLLVVSVNSARPSVRPSITVYLGNWRSDFSEIDKRKFFTEPDI
jgi:hypothetical protein